MIELRVPHRAVRDAGVQHDERLSVTGSLKVNFGVVHVGVRHGMFVRKKICRTATVSFSAESLLDD
jgi:hypothetical protein